MKIAQVVARYHPAIGGVETHVRRLTQDLSAMGDQVTVLTHQISNSPAIETDGSIHILRFPLTVGLMHYPFSRDLFRYLLEHAADFDVVHSHNYHTIVGQAAIRSRRPFVFTPHYHGTGHTGFRTMLHHVYRPIGARQFEAANAIICVSEAERGLVVRDFPRTNQKIRVIPNGTDTRIGAARQRRETSGEHIVLAVGRLQRYKNIDLVINAFHALSHHATLVIVGEGPERPRLEQLARSVDHRGRFVHFTGRITDQELDGLFARAEVITSASAHEAFGLFIAEGLVAGAHVVASDIPAHQEIARMAGPHAPVTLVNPRDTRQFAAALAAALDEGPVSADSVKLPSWDYVVNRTRELYTQVSTGSRLQEFEKVTNA